jgi:hypothetical protein
MKPGSKVVASHDIGAVRGKVTSNPNLDPDLINKRFEKAEEESETKKQISYSVPKELKGLENLIFLGANTRDIKLGEFSFTLSTLSAKQQEIIFKSALDILEQERILLFKKGVLASSIKRINGRPLSSYLEEDTFEARIELVETLQQSVFDLLFEELDEITSEAGKILTAENLKK